MESCGPWESKNAPAIPRCIADGFEEMPIDFPELSFGMSYISISVSNSIEGLAHRCVGIGQSRAARSGGDAVNLHVERSQIGAPHRAIFASDGQIADLNYELPADALFAVRLPRIKI